MEEKKKLPKGITQRKDGRYMGRFMYHGETYTVYDTNLRAVKKKLDNLKYEVEHNMYESPSKITVDKWFNEWIEVYKKPTVRITSIKNYKYGYSLISPYIGKKYIVDIRANDLQKAFNSLVTDGYADGTMHTVRTIVTGMFRQAFRSKIIKENPVVYCGFPKGKKAIRRYALTKEEQEVFLEYAKKYTESMYNFFLLALCTGMRGGELKGLRWQDIDFKNKIIHVTGTLVETPGKIFYRGEPKTPTSYRDIPLIEIASEALKDERKRQLENKMRFGKEWKPIEGLEDLVFLTRTGKPRYYCHVSQEKNIILAKMDKAGYTIENFSLHSLRHTFATRAIENGMNPQTLKAILGHSTLSMTMDLYSHVLPDKKQEEMQLIAQMF